MRTGIAIDFETANECPTSVCSVGAVLFEDGRIIRSYYHLIQPEPNYYKWFCQQVHGLGHCDTDDAPVFPEVWAELESEIGQGISLEDMGIPFVAHNSRFDEGCLKAVFRAYGMTYPDYVFMDTLAASRRCFGRSLPNHQLHTVSEACGYSLLNHHHALADAEACAYIAMKLLNETKGF